MLKQFPILEYERAPNCPASIPWEIVAPHELRAIKNHCRTLENLAYVGGLSPVELYWVFTDQPIVWLKTVSYDALQMIAVDMIKEKIAQFKQLGAAHAPILDTVL